jgi:uncharacterized protein with PQ loop repeat
MLGEILSWTFSTISNIAWLFVFIPQLIENYNKKSSDAVSFYLIALWYIGDTLSVVSAIYKSIHPVLIYMGTYHIIFDVVFLIQVIYYRLPRYLTRYHSYPLLLDETLYKYDSMLYYVKDVLLLHETSLLLGYSILLLSSQVICKLFPPIIVGDIFAWTSTVIFFLSRLPQILLNYKRRSVEGLSFTAFVNIIIANQLFLASILIKLIDIDNSNRVKYIIDNIPWIVGSSGTTLFDIIIFIQFFIYK